MRQILAASEATSQPSGPYDIVSKNIIRQNPDEFLQFWLGTPDVKAISVLETEQPVVKWYRSDSFIHANVRGQEAIVHFEFQTHDSTQVPMPFRMAGYAGLGLRMYKLPIYQHAIYFHPAAGENDPGEYVQTMPGYEIRIKYKVIRMCTIEGQAVLDAKLKGLIPFTPLMKPPEDMDSTEWLQQCVAVAETIPMDEADRPDYLASMAILSDVVFDNFHNIRGIISEGIMQASSFGDYFQKKTTIENLLDVLDVRFPSTDVQALKPLLENIAEYQTLKQLLRETARVPSFEEFKRILAANGS